VCRFVHEPSVKKEFSFESRSEINVQHTRLKGQWAECFRWEEERLRKDIYICTCTCTYKQFINTYIHTHTHIYIYIYIGLGLASARIFSFAGLYSSRRWIVLAGMPTEGDIYTYI